MFPSLKLASRGLALSGCLLVCAAGCATREPFRAAHAGSGPIRVACVGDSITYGAGVENREQNSYPAVLGRFLGPRFETKNLGVNGATLLRAGDKPYWAQPEFAALERYQPAIVILKLGTNDSKPQNWRYHKNFPEDLRSFIRHCRNFNPRPKMWVCFPVPVYETRWGIDDAIVKQEIIPAIKKVCREERVPTVDLYSALSNRPEYFPDKVHPNVFGAAMIAQILCYELRH